ncbi:hypothetical protein ASG87_18780 [Frateuria sp. Soil773]|nr:hypothetical protein ASG87_18780 [Frateuria sp. Soil773]
MTALRKTRQIAMPGESGRTVARIRRTGLDFGRMLWLAAPQQPRAIIVKIISSPLPAFAQTGSQASLPCRW